MTSHERPSSLAPPGDDLDDARIETLGLFLESHNRLVSQLNRELEEHANLSLQWLEMLLRLARTDGDCLKATELASEIALSSGGATRLVDRMESQGLVERRRNTTDRRGPRVPHPNRQEQADACVARTHRWTRAPPRSTTRNRDAHFRRTRSHAPRLEHLTRRSCCRAWRDTAQRVGIVDGQGGEQAGSQAGERWTKSSVEETERLVAER